MDTFFTAELKDNDRCPEPSKLEVLEGSRGIEFSLNGGTSGLVASWYRIIKGPRNETKVARFFGRVRG